MQTPIVGLQIADTCFYYPEDRGIAESVRYGCLMARAIDDTGAGGTALMPNEFLRFLSTGGFAAAVNLFSRYQLNKVLSFEIAVASSYLTGMVTAYVLARLLVFKASGRSVGAEFKRFAIVNIFSLLSSGRSASSWRATFSPRLAFTGIPTISPTSSVWSPPRW